jgi:hypothetical protein
MNEELIKRESYKSAFISNILLFGYWMTPEKILREQIDYRSKPTKIIAILYMLISSFFIGLSLLGMIDGPDIVFELLKLNFTFHSAMLDNYGIYSLLVLWAVVIIIGWFLPFMLLLLVNKGSNSKDRKATNQIFIVSCYSLLSFLLLHS